MQLYRGSGVDLSHDLASGALLPQLSERFRLRYGWSPAPSEVHSWEKSLPYVAKVLLTAGLGDVELLVEYQLTLTSKRADVVLVGSHPKGGVTAVIIENKQRTAADIEDVDERMVVVSNRHLLHPQQQVANYVQYLSDFNQLAHDGTLRVSGLAYLHNSSASEIKSLKTPALHDVARFPMFGVDDQGKLVCFLQHHLSGTGAGTPLCRGPRETPRRPRRFSTVYRGRALTAR